MNPTSYKLYRALCTAVTNASLGATALSQKLFLARYLQYLEYAQPHPP